MYFVSLLLLALGLHDFGLGLIFLLHYFVSLFGEERPLSSRPDSTSKKKKKKIPTKPRKYFIHFFFF